MRVGIYQIGLSGIIPRILYVGQSKWIEGRWKNHAYLLSRSKHHNVHLQNIYNKHGGGLTYTVLEECLISELDEKEQYYIDTLKPECNVVMDVKHFASSFREFRPDPVLLDLDLPGLEIDWKPQPWHRQVYGCRGRL